MGLPMDRLVNFLITSLKVIACLVLLVTISIGGWLWWDSRPEVLTELNKISLGMRKVDVTLALGEPDGMVSGLYRYDSRPYGAGQQLVFFNDDDLVSRVSLEGSSPDYLLPDGTYNSERAEEKYGKPNYVSINKDGTRQILSWSRYNLAVEFEQGERTLVFLADDGVSYREEYGE
jgi:hypothetical protein